MRPNRFRRFLSTAPTIFWTVAALFLVTGSVQGQATATLDGQIRTEDGHTIPAGVLIRIETTEGELVASQPPSSDGQFDIAGLPRIVVRVIVTAEGFQPYQENVDLGHGASRIIINVFLSPLGKTKPAPPDSLARSDENATKLARREYDKGFRALEKKKLGEAQAHLERAIAEYPCYARAQTDLGLVFSMKHDGAHAEAALRKAIECDPDFSLPYEILGELYIAQNRFSDAERPLQEGVRRSPGTWQFYYQLGVAHQAMEQPDKAEEEYLKVRTLTSAPPAQLYIKLSDLYTKKNAYDKAYAQMQAYLRAEPDGRFAARIKSVMREMESSGVLRAAQTGTSPSLPPKP